jgi:hypothetical protein
MADLFNYLREQKCYFDYTVNCDSVVQRVFFMWSSQANRWLDVGDVVVFDSTFNVNQLTLALSIFCTKNDHGLVEPLGYVLHFNKAAPDYQWAFEQQVTAVRHFTGQTVKPKVRYTDISTV